ncbi:MAG: glycosyltransferase [Alphaproteobacteria bacterium]|nr:glycosyltransferase [Alphaproteobacteria bacterium]
MMPAISVIIPIYNVEKYLRRCLDSVQNQTFQDWEAICVNDGSPDNSADILAEYAAKDARFKIVDKENGGLSDARNAGMKVATGEYILYLDSDDFIHPQTMEIAHSLAVRDKSDIVSFTYDRIYRPQLMVRHVLKMDTDNVVPRRMHKRYNLARIPTLTTDDVYEYATERTHNAPGKKKKWLIKHCQVWKNLYRRELIADIPFIKGILFEDFPWWSEVMLRNPRTTIVPLPLYFYIPNFGGIVLSAKQLRIMQSLCTGIRTAFLKYQEVATSHQMKKWSENFQWYFINWAFRKIKYIESEDEKMAAQECFRDLERIGALDRPPFRWAKKLRLKICDFIKTCRVDS